MNKLFTLVLASIICTSAFAQKNSDELRLRMELKKKGIAYSPYKTPLSTVNKKQNLLSEPEQDCSSAIAVCQNTYTQVNSYSGTGNVDEIPSGSSCLGDDEKNSVWYSFSSQTAGDLNFKITPYDLSDDYDWALYDITGKSCSDIQNGSVTPVRCNYSINPGITGLDASGVNTSEDYDGPNMSSILNTTAGKNYVLIISNFSETQNGYTIDFGTTLPGSAQIFDITKPKPSQVLAPCGGSYLTFIASEPIVCSSISTTGSEFTLTDNLGTTYTISTATGVDCGNASSQIKLTFTPTLVGTGPWKLTIKNGTDGNTLIDNCGNAMNVGDTISFQTIPNTSATITGPTDICRGSGVTLVASLGDSYLWSNGATTQSITVYPTASTSYSVSISNGTCGTSQASKNINIVSGPLADFTAVPNPVCIGQQITFTNTTQWYSCAGLGAGACNPNGSAPCGFILPCSLTDPDLLDDNTWSFGTGGANGYANTTDATFTYTDTGTYSVKLTTYLAPFLGLVSGCTSEKIQLIQVIPIADANWNNPGTVCAGGGQINLSPLVTGQTGGTFTCTTCPSGTLSGVNNATFDPAVAGVGSFSITYTVTGSCNASVSKTITVSNTADSSFTLPSPVCSNSDNINLDSLVTGTIGGSWLTVPANAVSVIGGKNYIIPSNYPGQSINVTYTTPTSVACPATTSTKAINIIQAPDADWTPPAFLCQSPFKLDLNTLSVNPNQPGTTSTWSGVGVTAGQLDYSFFTGNVSITHVVKSNVGTCSDTVKKVIPVKSKPDLTGGTVSNATCGSSNGAVINVSALPATGTYTYQWYTGTAPIAGNSINGQTNTFINNIAPGSYSIIVTSANGCTDTSAFTVLDTKPTVINTSLLATTNTTCGDDNGSITGIMANHAPVTAFIWKNAVTNQIISSSPSIASIGNLNAGTYELIVQNDANGCTDSISVTINDSTLANASFVANPTTGYDPLPVTFTNNSIGSSFVWAFGDTKTSTVVNPTNTFEKAGTYVTLLTVTDKFGCTDTMSVTIVVKETFSYVVPNIFTPNGDNTNDEFKIFGKGIKEVNYLIYDRWGKKVFEGNTPWNGDGSAAGAYYYIIDIKGAENTVVDNLKGYITLVR